MFMSDETQELVYECIATHNEEVLIELIDKLKKVLDKMGVMY